MEIAPVLFLVYRDPETTARVFEQIRLARPKQLFIAGDGPKDSAGKEMEECSQVRKIVTRIDWECDLKTRFLSKNYGLKEAVSSAICWFFEHVESGIIVEYDCLPSLSFFNFASMMLERYKSNHRVFSISGVNILSSAGSISSDYYYSRFTSVWGWATWRRSWEKWKPNFEDYEAFKRENVLRNAISNKATCEKMAKIFDAVHDGLNTSTWAYFLLYAQLREGGLSVIPSKNLIKNLGFTTRGTNSFDNSHPCANLTLENLDSYRSPKFFIPDSSRDSASLKVWLRPQRRSLVKRFIKKAGLLVVILLSRR